MMKPSYNILVPLFCDGKNLYFLVWILVTIPSSLKNYSVVLMWYGLDILKKVSKFFS